jgi:hypothetical protein
MDTYLHEHTSVYVASAGAVKVQHASKSDLPEKYPLVLMLGYSNITVRVNLSDEAFSKLVQEVDRIRAESSTLDE